MRLLEFPAVPDSGLDYALGTTFASSSCGSLVRPPLNKALATSTFFFSNLAVRVCWVLRSSEGGELDERWNVSL